MRIKFIKVNEGRVKAANKAAKRGWEEKEGGRTEGFNEKFKKAAQLQVAKGKNKTTQAGVSAGKRAVARASRKQNSSTEILGNKIVESFNGLLDRMDETSKKLKRKAARLAKKKAKQHARIASAAGEVKATDTQVQHDVISREKIAQANRFEDAAQGKRTRSGPGTKRRKQQYFHAKKEAGVGSRRVPVSKR